MGCSKQMTVCFSPTALSVCLFPFSLESEDYLTNSIHLYLLKVKYLRTKYQVLDIEVDGGVGIPTIDAAAQVTL